MVAKLFRERPPRANETLLDPGCGRGAFVEGVLRWCKDRGQAHPEILAVDSDPSNVAICRQLFAGVPRVRVELVDFLRLSAAKFNYVIGNPPYVPITGLSEDERAEYRAEYHTARGRFDLYLLFFEKALRLLQGGGRMVFITPEKFTFVDTAEPLRSLLTRYCVEELHFVDENTFEGLVTYPLISTISAEQPCDTTVVIDRNDDRQEVALKGVSSSWLPLLRGFKSSRHSFSLSDVCVRISCGVATGADSVFVTRTSELEPGLRQFAHPTIAGREIVSGQPVQSKNSMLVPYTLDGRLIPEEQLGDLGLFLSKPKRAERLLNRTCVARKPWYSFHENPPMREILRPKLLCKDITPNAFFVIDRSGDLIPRHSVYYLVPVNPNCLDELADYLNSPPAQDWLRDHCQRAANGFLRLQSHVLKCLPIPDDLARSSLRAVEQPLLDESLA